MKVLSCGYYSLILTLCFFCLGSGQVRVAKSSDHRLVYWLEQSDFLNEKAKKNLSSGLASRLVIVARLSDQAGGVVQEQWLSLESRYDLWAEKYQTTLSGRKSLSISNLSDVETLYNAPGPFEWMSMDQLKGNHAYRLELTETFNPVDKEKFQSLQRWLTQQRLSLRGGGASAESSVSNVLPETPFTSLFYGFWKKATESNTGVGELFHQEDSEWFKPENLGELPLTVSKRSVFSREKP